MAADVSQRIRALYSTFSKGQKKIANAVLESYEKCAYMTAARLGQMVGVSESTVVRFANELGFEGYSEFQNAVQELVRIKLTPNQRIEITRQRIGRGDIVDKVMESDIAKIRHTMETIDKDAFQRSVDLIVEAKTLYVMGARSSENLANILCYNLSLISDNVRLVSPSSTAEIFEQMFSVGESDVIFAFSFPRYSTKMVNAVKFAKQNKARLILLTDSTVCPLAEYADCLLTAESDMASYMDSLVAPLSIINAIVVGITNKSEKKITARFDRLEQLWDEYGVYNKR